MAGSTVRAPRIFQIRFLEPTTHHPPTRAMWLTPGTPAASSPDARTIAARARANNRIATKGAFAQTNGSDVSRNRGTRLASSSPSMGRGRKTLSGIRTCQLAPDHQAQNLVAHPGRRREGFTKAVPDQNRGNIGKTGRFAAFWELAVWDDFRNWLISAA